LGSYVISSKFVDCHGSGLFIINSQHFDYQLASGP
jgi:hypothetical protein